MFLFLDILINDHLYCPWKIHIYWSIIEEYSKWRVEAIINLKCASLCVARIWEGLHTSLHRWVFNTSDLLVQILKPADVDNDVRCCD